MKWIWSVFCGTALLAGCNGSGQTMDPFLGRSTIPPPSTGQVISPGTAQPYYQGNPLPVTPVPATPPPGVSVPPGTPPAGSSFRQSDPGLQFVETPGEREYRVGRSAVAQPSPTALNVDNVILVDGATGSVADSTLIVRSLSDSTTVVRRDQSGNLPRTVSPFKDDNAASALAAGPAVPARFQPPKNAVDISKLPRANDVANKRGPTNPAIFVSRSDAPRVALPESRAKTRRQTSRYGYAGDHSWLTGQLEYLRSKREWKLRYIPIDGDTDEYGGSVVIDDASLLKEYEAGQFVAVKGAIDASKSGEGSFAPSYRVERIKPLAE